VESDRAALEIVKKNLEASRQLDKSEVVCCDALKFLSHTSTRFDIIFLDPPYNQGLLTKSIEAISAYNLLSHNGIIVCETEAGGEYPSSQHFKILKQAKYGKTMVFVLANAKDTER
jgi:16S rRNA (guanine966-N2)-methyltransferase